MKTIFKIAAFTMGLLIGTVVADAIIAKMNRGRIVLSEQTKSSFIRMIEIQQADRPRFIESYRIQLGAVTTDGSVPELAVCSTAPVPRYEAQAEEIPVAVPDIAVYCL